MQIFSLLSATGKTQTFIFDFSLGLLIIQNVNPAYLPAIIMLWKYISCSLCAIQMQGAHAFTGAVLIDVLKCSHMKHIVN